MIAAGTTINYLSRNCLAVLSPQLEGVMHFGAKEYSYIVGAFQIAYTIMQPVCGWALDRLGARAGFALFAVNKNRCKRGAGGCFQNHRVVSDRVRRDAVWGYLIEMPHSNGSVDGFRHGWQCRHRRILS